MPRPPPLTPSRRLFYSLYLGHSRFFSAFLGHLRAHLNINIFCSTLSLNIYAKAAFRVLRGAPVPSAAADTDGSKLAAWNTANENLYNVLFFTTKGAACSAVRRFAGKTLDEGSGHGQRAWAARREKFHGCSREALRAENAKMNSARMSPGQDPDEFLYELDTRRERLIACDPPEGPTDRQFMDIILQALLLEYKRICTSHLEKARLRDRRHSLRDVRYLCGQRCLFELDDGDCGAWGCHTRGRRQPQIFPLLRTCGPFQEHVSPPRQARAAATTTRETEQTTEPAAGRTASTRPA